MRLNRRQISLYLFEARQTSDYLGDLCRCGSTIFPAGPRAGTVEHLVSDSRIVQWHRDADSRSHAAGLQQFRDLGQRPGSDTRNEIIPTNPPADCKRHIGLRHR